MLFFLEKHLRKKIGIAEQLYLNQVDKSDQDISEEAGISLSTFHTYEKELIRLFMQHKKNGMLYNSSAFLVIAQFFIKESTRLALLKLLLFYPGGSSEFYKAQLKISDATFSRIVSKLREKLALFQVKIVIKNGYRLEAQDEVIFVLLMAHIGTFYQFPLSEVYQRIAELQSDVVGQYQKPGRYLDYIICGSKFEQEFFQQIEAYTLLRAVQLVQLNPLTIQPADFEKQVDLRLEQHYRETVTQIDTSFHQVIAAYFIEKPSEPHLRRLRQLVTVSLFQLVLFPYEIDTLSLRVSTFVRKFEQGMPEEFRSMQTFLYRMVDIFRVNFFKRKDLLYFFFITESLILQPKNYRKKVFLFSDITQEHGNYLYEKIVPLTHFFDEQVTLVPLADFHDQTLKKEDLLITTQYFEELPRYAQFLVSDYVSLQELVQIGLWIRESVQRE